jgi:hypothetical protein
MAHPLDVTLLFVAHQASHGLTVLAKENTLVSGRRKRRASPTRTGAVTAYSANSPVSSGGLSRPLGHLGVRREVAEAIGFLAGPCAVFHWFGHFVDGGITA